MGMQRSLSGLAAWFGLHVDQNTVGTYIGKVLAVAALVAGGILCPADILYKGFAVSISAATESRIVWWCIAVGVVAGWIANQKTLAHNPNPAPAQSRTGVGMTTGLLLATGALAASLTMACAGGLRDLRPGPNGYTRAQVATLLTDASWGLQEGCSAGWVPPDACSDVGAGLKAAVDVVNKADAATLQADVVAALQRVRLRLPAGSRALPYFGYVIKLLGGN